jgi:Zn-dependent M28 family amino/carboxypeptidase
VYKEKGSRRHLRFVAFGGEEMGVWGSKYYVKCLRDQDKEIRKNRDFELDGLRTELDRHRFLINLDMMGPLYGSSTAVTLGDNDIAAATRLLANELRYAITIREQAVYSSDNMTFNYAGVPSISFFRGPFEKVGGHTEEDTIRSCSPEGLAHIGRFIEAWIDRYVESLHSFPFSRSLPDQAADAAKKWFKGKDPLDYEVFGPEKKYTE